MKFYVVKLNGVRTMPALPPTPSPTPCKIFCPSRGGRLRVAAELKARELSQALDGRTAEGSSACLMPPSGSVQVFCSGVVVGKAWGPHMMSRRS